MQPVWKQQRLWSQGGMTQEEQTASGKDTESFEGESFIVFYEPPVPDTENIHSRENHNFSAVQTQHQVSLS